MVKLRLNSEIEIFLKLFPSSVRNQHSDWKIAVGGKKQLAKNEHVLSKSIVAAKTEWQATVTNER